MKDFPAIARAVLGAVLMSLALLACHAPPPASVATSECPVCRAEGDLACLCVEIEADTPHCEVDGQTFYFCSDECRSDFLAHPERYAHR